MPSQDKINSLQQLEFAVQDHFEEIRAKTLRNSEFLDDVINTIKDKNIQFTLDEAEILHGTIGVKMQPYSPREVPYGITIAKSGIMTLRRIDSLGVTVFPTTYTGDTVSLLHDQKTIDLYHSLRNQPEVLATPFVAG